MRFMMPVIPKGYETAPLSDSEIVELWKAVKRGGA